MFEGLVVSSSREDSKKIGDTLLWSDESVKSAIRKLPTVAKDWENQKTPLQAWIK